MKTQNQEHRKLKGKEWRTLTRKEQERLCELDELLCIPGSISHDKKLQKENEDYLKSIAMKGGCVHS